jgi:hypothetical protein
VSDQDHPRGPFVRPALPKPGPAPRASFLPPLKLPAEREAARLEAERIAALPPVPLKGRSAPVFRAPMPRDPVPPPAQSLVTEKLPQRLQARLHAVGADRLRTIAPGGDRLGWAHENLRNMAVTEYGHLGVKSLTELTEDQALYLIQCLEKLPLVVQYVEPEQPAFTATATPLRLPPKTVELPVVRTRLLADDSLLITSPPERSGEVMKDGVEISPALGRPMTDNEILNFMADAGERKKLAAATNPNAVWKPGPVRTPEPTAVTPVPAAPPPGATGKAWFLPPRR